MISKLKIKNTSLAKPIFKVNDLTQDRIVYLINL